MKCISYLDENKFLLELSALSTKQSGFSEEDIERLAKDCTNKEILSSHALLFRSYLRAYNLLKEFEYGLNENGRFVPIDR